MRDLAAIVLDADTTWAVPADSRHQGIATDAVERAFAFITKAYDQNGDSYTLEYHLPMLHCDTT